MRTWKRNLVLVLALSLAVAPIALASPKGPSKALERSAGVFDRVAFANQMIQLGDRLAAEQVDVAFAAPLRVEVTPEDLDGIRNGMAFERKIKVGVNKELSVAVDFSDIRGRLALETVRDFGALRGNEDNFVWSGPVISPGAAALRVHITDFDMPDGSELYVYTPEGMAFGPYTGRGPNGTGEFWTNTVVGSDVILQVYRHGGSSDQPSFVVSGVGHITDRFQLAKTLAPRPQAAEPNCSFNEPCVVGAGCVTGVSAVEDARTAVALMLFSSGAWQYICSGGLIADSDDSSDIPYFMTANHCISKGGEASSLEAFFDYSAPCGTSTTCALPGNPSTNGSSIVASNRKSDFTLLQLSQSAPSGSAFLGWNSDPVAFNGDNPGDPPTYLYRISHPAGAPQSYSEHVVDPSRPTCRSWPRGGWIYSSDVFGATEGGSSGSPVMNADGEIVGQLSGACGYDVNNPCNADENATVDGAFAAYYDKVAQYLGPGGGGTDPGPDPTCTDADGDGYCVEDGDCDDSDPHVYPGHNDTKGRWGRDNVDNDCNGIIDG